MSMRKIEAWHEAGVIDAATRDRLIAHEAAHARPIALWAVFGIGALAVALGLVSVVAANWEAIPGPCGAARRGGRSACPSRARLHW